MDSPFRFRSQPGEMALRNALIDVGRLAYDRGLLTANDGNLSCRLGADSLLMSPSGICKGRMASDDLLVLDMSGTLKSKPTGSRHEVSTEAPMHVESYRQRPDVGAVIHAHPPYCIALTVADVPLRADVLPEVLATLGSVPTADFAMPASEEGATAIRDLIRQHDVILLRQHGALAVGADLEEALIRLERVEHAAKVIFLATLLGKVSTLPAEARDRLLAMYAAGKTRGAKE